MRLGIDIGGTAVKLGVVDDAHRVIDSRTIPTKATRPADDILADIIKAARPLCDTYHPRFVGIGSPGRVDPVRGLVLRAGHLPFCDTPVPSIIGEALGLPAAIDNDANCAMLAEHAIGACADKRDALMVTIGTGIGGAILIGGKLYRGFNFRAGELGHFILDHKGKPCPCGLHGCYEQYASASALVSDAEQAITIAPDSLLAALGKERGTNGKVVFDAVKEGCPVAAQVLARYGEYVAMGLNSFIKIFMPECIVLAGGITKAGKPLLDAVTPHLLPEADIRISTLGGDAGILGAALLENA